MRFANDQRQKRARAAWIATATLLAVLAPPACGGTSRGRDDSNAGTGNGTSGTTGRGGSGDDGGAAGEAGSVGGAAPSGGGPSGGVAGAAGEGNAGAGGEPDLTYPTIASASPSDGESGVRKDANIVITFSEPMDRAATEGAFRSRQFDQSDVTFRWNDAGTVLTVDPNADLPYRVAQDLSYAALDYEFWIDVTAADLAGNLLRPSVLVPASFRFTTLREITLRVPAQPLLDVHCSMFECVDGTGILAGDSADDRGYRGFFSFDIGSIPDAIGPEHVETATLRAYQERVEGLVYDSGPNGLGSLILDHVDYGSSFSTSDYDAPPLESVGVLSTSSAIGWQSADVTHALEDDLVSTSRGNRSQFRVRFIIETNGDGMNDGAYFEAQSEGYTPELVVELLVP